MFCDNCGNQITGNEKFCSKCGTPVKISLDNTTNKDNTLNINAPITDPVNPVSAMQDITFNATENPKDSSKKSNGAKNFLSNIFKKSSNNKSKIPLLIGAAVILLLIAGVANAAKINNLFHKTFSSPESYYQYVEKKALENMYEMGGDLYSSFILESLNLYDRSISGEVSVELGKKGEDLLDLFGLAGVDISWLKSVQAEGNLSIKDSMFSMGFGTSLNKTSIFSSNMIMDIENSEIYIQIPELTKSYLGMDLEDILDSWDYREFEEFQDMQEMSKDLINALPSESQVKKFLQKYTTIALKCVNDVEISSKKIKVEGIENKYTELEVTFDSDTIESMIEAVLEEMAEDKDIEKIIVNVAETIDEDGDDVYEEFQESIEDMLDDLSVDEDMELVMKVYVDGKGEIKGRVFEWEDYWTGENSISILTPQKGNKVGFEFSMEAGKEKMEISGSGKVSGNTFTGECELNYRGNTILDITAKKLNISDLKAGRLNGEIGLKLSSGAEDFFSYKSGGYSADRGYYSEYSSTPAYLSIIKNLELKIDADSSKNSSKCKFTIVYKDDDVLSITTSVKTGSGSKTSVPNSKNAIMVEDLDDLLDWVDEIDWDKMLDNLEKADIPDDVLDEIEDFIDMVEDGNLYQLYRYFR